MRLALTAGMSAEALDVGGLFHGRTFRAAVLPPCRWARANRVCTLGSLRGFHIVSPLSDPACMAVLKSDEDTGVTGPLALPVAPAETR